MPTFSKDAGNALVYPTIELTMNKLNKYKKRFQSLYNEINTLDNNQKSILNKLQSIANTDERLMKLAPKDMAKEVLKTKNKEVKDNIAFSEASQLLEKLEQRYKEAYELINEFRSIFFEPITYSYGFTQGGQTYSVSGLTFNEIADLISLQVASKTTELDNAYKLRFNPTKAALEQFRKTHADKIIQLTPQTEKGSTLWSTLDRYRKKYSKGSDYYINKGQLYEVYRSIISSEGVDNGPPAPFFEEEFILTKFIEVRKNNLSWTKGGDVEDEQDKFMRASVTSAATLLTILKDLIFLLNEEHLNAEKIASTIAKKFADTGLDSTASKQAKEVAEKAIADKIAASIIIK